ncbi:MAG: translation initiation factor IF-3 [Candidatus Taylorbacteria bacterium RIFCSPLOWO2_12_FULL_43_20]|uniref:Translation initiation factor IF-3 n=1 Tax=Candidatus Taylorbacteria bacterium RIFCSPLOWO2_12_FULL_43_20 TaxID=1802332 RepID=A0A1G2P4L2_9BACT|nr:MAG: translation initiation factor IF-3 [Candidatus Taylorbacteria bacterium RIFCSPHIGHO2_01_FULL_43_120]OHA23482.1 MAG: translation initiation factor IF-3 [Candidatus Taylorbacteria bacterium RIFCSPHIGHO2_02_FULL_43_55]OHA29692.1 MAG: translation initiation factor IF-3 [Candidatus Taylorbacteria bacterium RIFCSPHIGHO2_12_FULL_42_34]OHA31617.1 MAG: translation initiation factor IF-3 [Candidatus Taylorbacteria bacterium RIFCSPLOWO2_01_FULL_43_83]OHA39001.1 MAG: translation initiation factor I
MRINHQIRSPELRVIGSEGENLGILTLSEALKAANENGQDLIEISPNAKPPVAKIMDYGKFQYAEKKRMKAAKAKSHSVETKTIQVKIGTGEHDLELKAKKASEWLKEGHRIKIELFLIGRTKYMDFQFLKQRLERILKLITEEYKIADSPKKSPKGITTIIEKV